jgi:hypothetical protein
VHGLYPGSFTVMIVLVVVGVLVPRGREDRRWR